MILRNTKQRDDILELIHNSDKHMTADEIHKILSLQDKKVGIATIYRNLNRLVDERKVVKISDRGGCYFDGNSVLHYHMRCTCCSKLVDVPMDYQSDLDEFMQSKMNVQILSHQLIFDYICDDCAKLLKKKEKNDDKFKRY
ncbi:MAG: Fur family transcriptional regulator [Anaerorhabdus sp.]